MADKQLNLVVLISGRGSNFQAILDAVKNGELAVNICAVISNRPDAKGLERAHQAGIETHVIDHKLYPDRATFDTELRKIIDGYQPGLVVLAGFMRILSEAFVNHYRGRLINIHPSLLPEYRGLHTHERVLRDGATEHGASVHFVTPGLDEGPVIMQAAVPVYPNDDADTLAARVLIQEHKLYPLSVNWFAEGRLSLRDYQVFLDGELMPTPYRMETD